MEAVIRMYVISTNGFAFMSCGGVSGHNLNKTCGFVSI